MASSNVINAMCTFKKKSAFAYSTLLLPVPELHLFSFVMINILTNMVNILNNSISSFNKSTYSTVTNGNNFLTIHHKGHVHMNPGQ